MLLPLYQLQVSLNVNRRHKTFRLKSGRAFMITNYSRAEHDYLEVLKSFETL